MIVSPAKIALREAVRRRTENLLAREGLNGWQVKFDRSLRRAGTCRYELKELVFSIHFMEVCSEEARENTILHEIAHALAGPQAAHGEAWAETHRALGGNGESFTPMPEELSSHEYFLWVGACSNCAYRTGLEEAPDGVWICKACDSSLPAPSRFFTWTRDGELMAPEAIGERYLEEHKKWSN